MSRCFGKFRVTQRRETKVLMLHFLVAIFGMAVAGNQAPNQPAPWQKYHDQAVQLQEQGRYAEAEAAYRSAMQEAESLGRDNPAIGFILMSLGRLRMRQQDYSGARAAFEHSLDIVEKRFARDHFGVGLLLTNIAMTYHIEGRYGMAEPFYRRALVILEKTLGPEDSRTATTQEGMAKLLLVQGRNTEAEALFEKVIRVLEKTHEPDDPNLAIALISLAEAYRVDGRYARAEPLYRRTLVIVQESPKLRTDEVSEGLSHFPAMLQKMKRKAEARELDKQIKTMLPR
jgi:tetratricopeptide (TPR) repeat protein